MEIVKDVEFENSFRTYYEGVNNKVILDSINQHFYGYETSLMIDVVNIIKTSMTIGLSYSECHKKIIDGVAHRFPLNDDIDKFILDLTIKTMIAMGSVAIEELIKPARDINREVTASHFRTTKDKVTDEMIATVLEAADKFNEQSYSVTDPAVESWDDYFYNVCKQVARNSKCLSRRIGAVMVYDKSIISTGYNGPPRGVPRCDLRWKLDDEFAEKYKDKIEGKEIEGICPRYVIGFESGGGLEICPAGHAERNALINAARNGIRTKDTSLYMSCGIPCTPCLVEIINAGVSEIVVTSLRVYDETAMYLLNQSNLGVRLFDFIK